MFCKDCYLIVICFLVLRQVQGRCPEKCSCKKINEGFGGLNVQCGSSQNKVNNLKELDFEDDFTNIITLDLSKNQISYVDKVDFVNYTNLKRLDLSFNSLKKVDESMFAELISLERLKLSNNAIVHIFQGSFENLKALKQLDISSNPLACDCDLLWLVAWSSSFVVRLQPKPKCETPKEFKGFSLKKLRVGYDLYCESPSQPLLELKPSTDQLVFEGDELVLRCRAARVAVGAPKESEDLPARAHVFWGWSEKIVDSNSTEDVVYRDPTKHFPSIQIDAKHLSDSGLLDSILKIPYVTRNYTGMWDCRLRSQQANLSRTISVIVVSNKTQYCPAYVLNNNKGKYYWPRTISEKTVRLPCSGESLLNVKAIGKCNKDGEWVDINTEACPFISESTRILEQFAKVNLSIARGSVLESAKRLRNYTQSNDNLRKLRDPIDLVFIAKTLRNYLSFVSEEKDLGAMLLDIVSQIIILPSFLGQQAQAIDGSGTKLIQAVELAAQHTPLSLTHKPHLAIEYFKIRSDSFTGLTCTWLQSDIDLHKRIFQCNTANLIIDILRQQIDASLQIQENFVHSKFSQQFIAHKLMVAVYENGNFFPHNTDQGNFQVTSAIVGVKIITENLDFTNLTNPISIMLRVRPFHNEKSAPVPVWWDPDTNQWTRNGCQTSYHFQGMLVFTCKKLGYYGLLQNKMYLNDFLDENAGARYRFSPIGFYVGCTVLFICSWINIVTYISSGVSLQMGRRQRHALINTWLALSSLSLVFGIGIYQTEDYRVCQIIGISVHYLSLCIILWVCVSVSNMYKRLSKRNLIPIDDLPREHVGRKPILGIYLVGWGIGMIICGISGAVNIREYASYSHCFLKNGPSLSTLFVPSAILLVFLCILFICVRCHIRIANVNNGHFSEGTQGTENVDLELLESTTNYGVAGNVNQPERYRSLTISSPSTSMHEDLEHSLGAQLRAHFIFLLLYVLTWLSAAASVVKPFDNEIIYEEQIFSIIFLIASSILGIFLLFFYSISRSDVRGQWDLISCQNFCSQCCCSPNIPRELTTTVTYHQTCGTVNSGSRTNSQCSKNRPPSIPSNHGLRHHHDINSIGTLNRTDSPNKMMQGASSSLIRQQYVHNPVILTQEIPNADIFYNPNQINVARKFFKKQKRLAKRNNFELQRQIERGNFCDGMSDVSSNVGSYPKPRGISIFSSGSKVNNTNIHVRGDAGNFSKEARQQTLNPNILSDSCNESDMIVDAERFVLGVEGMRVHTHRNKVTEMVANIYTNVPETSHPQHEIVTMRADDKFRKSVNMENFLEQDELDMEKNDLNSQNERTSTPLYVNGNIRNIVGEQVESFNANTNAKTDTSCQGDEVCESIDPNLKQTRQDRNSNDQLIIELNSPITAMNTIGLPEPLNEQQFNTSNEENTLDLGMNEAYVSESLQISDRVYQNDNDTAIRITQFEQIKSKSLISLNVNRGQCGGSKRKADEFHESQVRSISCSNLSIVSGGIKNILNQSPAKNLSYNRIQDSPILFSPSLCDLPSPQDRRKPMVLAEESLVIDDEISAGSFDGHTNNSDSLHLFSQCIRRNFSSSPTCESDLNYQNSELSIRSHGVYAPQPDNDINMTLTNLTEDMYYPYQSSEVSEVDEDNDFDDFNNCSNDCLLPQEPDEDLNGSHASLDELYQMITRRSLGDTANIIQRVGSDSIQNDISSAVNSNFTNNSNKIVENELYKNKTGLDLPNNTFEDDSSQSSIISYIDPNSGIILNENS